jgi:hypothetical protein
VLVLQPWVTRVEDITGPLAPVAGVPVMIVHEQGMTGRVKVTQV